MKRPMSHRPIICPAIGVTLVAILLSGCGDRLETGYGRGVGAGYATSVNGTIVFQKMVRATGRDVDRDNRISPRWEQYHTVYWFPDGFAAPDETTVKRIETWLAGGEHRTMVLVGRDYDAETSYWQSLSDASSTDSDRKFARSLADATTRHLMAQNGVDRRDNAWYHTRTWPTRRAKRLSGPMSTGIDLTQTRLRYRALPLPGKSDEEDVESDYEVETLLAVDGIPFCYVLRKTGWRTSRLIIVGNGSFLLNLTLTNPSHRQLANGLIREVHGYPAHLDDVLFIQSGPQIPYRQTDAEPHQSKWLWITKPPLRYIVPHILFWCLLLCFVYFPIFGRPRRIKSRSSADFREHIVALAKLMSKTGERTAPDAWIDEYRARTSRHGRGGLPVRTRNDGNLDHHEQR